MLSRRYKVVDVFSAVPLAGNPVAVVFDADDLDPAMMQAIARWTNLSETTFLLAPTMSGADYRLRIFTPLRELPFAGHPTLGSAHAALEAGLVTPRSGRLVQQCEVGLVPLSVTGDDGSRSLSFELPKPRFITLQSSDVQELEVALGEPILASTPPAIIDVGAVWLVAQLPTTSALLALRPDFPAIDVLSRRLGVTGLSLFAQYSSGDAAIWPLPASTTWLRKASVQGVPGVLQFGSNPQSG